MLVLVTLECIKRCLVWVIFHTIFNMLCISFDGCTNCLMFLVAFNNVPGLLIACTILLWWLQRWINVEYFYFKKLNSSLFDWTGAGTQPELVGGYLDASVCTHLPEARSSTGAGRCCSSSQRSPAVRIRQKKGKIRSKRLIFTPATGNNPVVLQARSFQSLLRQLSTSRLLRELLLLVESSRALVSPLPGLAAASLSHMHAFLLKLEFLMGVTRMTEVMEFSPLRLVILSSCNFWGCCA